MPGALKRLISLFLPKGGFKLPSLKENLAEYSVNLEAMRRRMENIPATQYALGHLHLRQGNAFDARMRFNRVLRTSPKEGVRFYLACALLQAGDQKRKAAGEDILRAIASAQSPYAREASFLLDESEGRDIPAVPPFSLVARFEQYAEKHPQEERAKFVNDQAALLPLKDKEDAGNKRKDPQRESRFLYHTDADERLYAEHLVNLLSEFHTPEQDEPWLILGDRYGHIRRYVEEKRMACKAVYASPRLIIPEYVTGEDVARERTESAEEAARLEPLRVSGYGDPLIQAGAPFAAVICPYMTGRYATPALQAQALSPALTPGAFFAFGTFTANDETEVGFNLTAKMFAVMDDDVRRDMEEEKAEYIRVRRFVVGGEERGRTLHLFRLAGITEAETAE